jgi:hypothetical protein
VNACRYGVKVGCAVDVSGHAVPVLSVAMSRANKWGRLANITSTFSDSTHITTEEGVHIFLRSVGDKAHKVTPDT